MSATTYAQTEVNEQTLGAVVWGKLLRKWSDAHGEFHRGHFMDIYCEYVQGVADALYMNADAITEYVREQGQ